MSITLASLLQKPRKILNTVNYEKYNLFEQVGLRLLNILFGITYPVINPYCLAIFLKKGSPSFITASSPVATGRQIDSPYESSGGILIKLSIAIPPLNSIAASVANISFQSQVPHPGIPRSDSDR